MMKFDLSGYGSRQSVATTSPNVSYFTKDSGGTVKSTIATGGAQATAGTGTVQESGIEKFVRKVGGTAAEVGKVLDSLGTVFGRNEGGGSQPKILTGSNPAGAQIGMSVEEAKGLLSNPLVLIALVALLLIGLNGKR